MTITGLFEERKDILGEEDESQGTARATQSFLVYSDDPVNDRESHARAYVRTNAPTSYDDMVRTKIATTELVKAEHGEAIWRCSVTYESPELTQRDPVEPGDPIRISVRSAGQGSSKRLYSDELLEEQSNTSDSIYDFDGTPLELAMGIKFDGPGNPDFVPEGIDYPLGVTHIIAEQAVLSSTISAGYLVRLAEAANQSYTNSDLWNGFAAGTLRFLEFDATENGSTDVASQFYTLSFTLEFQRNIPIAEINAQLAVLGIDPFTTISQVKGHEHIEINSVQEEVQVDAGPPVINKICQTPVRAAVHRIYPVTAFGTLFNPAASWP